MIKTLPGKMAAFVLLSLIASACQKDRVPETEALSEPATSSFKSRTADPEGIIFYALAGTMLDKYSTSNPEQLLNTATITGLQNGERILGMDFRPATGQLYALGSNSRLYILDPQTGRATFVAALTIALEGTSFGFDFNPAVDRIRIVSNTDQNLRVHPVTGATITDARINPGAASVTAVAYDNNDTDPATGTELYALDATTDLLYEIDPPNAGTLIAPLPVKLKLEGDGGFDIAPRNAAVTTDIALALFDVNKKATLFRIDVATGETKILAKYKKELMYTAIAISPELNASGTH